MGFKIISRRIEARKVSIKMVDGSLVQGKINLLSDESVVQRVSDIFTKVTDPFVVVFEATAEGKSGRVLILNKRNIAWVSPEDDVVRPEAEQPADSRGSSMDRLRRTYAPPGLSLIRHCPSRTGAADSPGDPAPLVAHHSFRPINSGDQEHPRTDSQYPHKTNFAQPLRLTGTRPGWR